MSAIATWVLLLAKAWSWLKSPNTYQWVKARQKRREDAEKKKRIAIKLSVILFVVMALQGCATCDKIYLWAYEGLNGVPQEKPMNEEQK